MEAKRIQRLIGAPVAVLEYIDCRPRLPLKYTYNMEWLASV